MTWFIRLIALVNPRRIILRKASDTLKCIDTKLATATGLGLTATGQVVEPDHLGIQVRCASCEEGTCATSANLNLVITTIDLETVDVIHTELTVILTSEQTTVKECFDVSSFIPGGQIVSNVVTVSGEVGASKKHNAESTGVLSEVTDCGEDCESPKKAADEVGVELVCLDTVYSTEEADKTVEKPGHLSAACLSPITGGSGLGTVYNEEESYCTVGVGTYHLFIDEASTEEGTEGRKEPESESTCDCNDNAAAARLTENADLAGAYIGDLTIAVFRPISIDCEHQKSCDTGTVTTCGAGADIGGRNTQPVAYLDIGCTTATETNLCALCLLVSVLKVIGPLTVKTVIKSVSGHMSDETCNDTIQLMLVLPELITDHAAIKALCPVPEKPLGVDFISIILTKLAGEVTVSVGNPQELSGKVTCLTDKCYTGPNRDGEKLLVEEAVESSEVTYILIEYCHSQSTCVTRGGVMSEQAPVVIKTDLRPSKQTPSTNEIVTMACEVEISILKSSKKVKSVGSLDAQAVYSCGPGDEGENITCESCRIHGSCLAHKIADIRVVEPDVVMLHHHSRHVDEIESCLCECEVATTSGLGLNCTGQGTEPDHMRAYVAQESGKDHDITTANRNLEIALIDHDTLDCSHPELSIPEDASETHEVEKKTGLAKGATAQSGGQILSLSVVCSKVVGALTSGIILELTDPVENCESPGEASKKVETNVLCHGIVSSSEEVKEVVYCTGHLASACLSHASGGCGTETAHDDKQSNKHADCVSVEVKVDIAALGCSFLLSSTDKPS